MGRNLKLVLAYDGTGFSGFAPQPGRRTVAAEIEKALHRLFKKHIKITGASRTDSGVHALGQTVNFTAASPLPVGKLPLVLNTYLPPDIRALQAEKVPAKFSSRFSAKSKEYEYLIYNGAELPVHLRNQVWAIKPKLDISAMKKAAKMLVGKHDFSSFCASGSNEKNFVRTLYEISIFKRQLSIITGQKISMISLSVKGNAFLYKMIRNIVGTLVQMGLGKLQPGEMENIVKARDRRRAGKCAPPQGLYLIRVNY